MPSSLFLASKRLRNGLGPLLCLMSIGLSTIRLNFWFPIRPSFLVCEFGSLIRIFGELFATTWTFETENFVFGRVQFFRWRFKAQKTEKNVPLQAGKGLNGLFFVGNRFMCARFH